MIKLKGKNILVTGSSSMIGKAVVKRLKEIGAIPMEVHHNRCNLLYGEDLKTYYGHGGMDYCIHLAGYNGNIQFNKKYPADIFYQTAQMALNVLKFCQEEKINKVVSLLPSCAYPDGLDVLKEEDFHEGKPNNSVECHGLSKRILFDYSRQLHKQYGMTCISLITNNSYGPHDSFDVNKTKVVGGLIKRFVEAKQNGDGSVTCWGTGNPRREFVYCDDVAEGIIKSLELYDDSNLPLNIGVGEDISIRELAEKVSLLVGYEGETLWNVDAGDGQMKKLLDITKMKQVLNYEPRTSLDEGLRKTIEWYVNKT